MKSRRHEELGEALAAAARAAGVALVLAEAQGIDRLMFLCRNGKQYRLAGEMELSERHCLVNCLRDLREHHCDGVLIVCPDERIQARVARKIARHLPAALQPRVGIFIYADLHKGCVDQWIDSLILPHQLIDAPRLADLYDAADLVYQPKFANPQQPPTTRSTHETVRP